ncbi:hypothetical protein WJX81_006601 [Elliptochloris bilobata]|uniref:Uncharacterized protein n=1 Tax=Elliptochloris bilobata TaxID=381761 RepID=A0AAW1QYS0_9CHLO
MARAVGARVRAAKSSLEYTRGARKVALVVAQQTSTAVSSEGLLKGKRALVTGASRGIGACIAINFAREGAQLVLVARTKNDLEKIGEECTKAGAEEVDVRPCSLMDGAAVQKLGEAVLADYGHVDVLVNAAGIFEYSSALEGDIDAADELLYLNLNSPIRLTRVLAPAMAENGGGDIINISSVAGIEAYGNQAVYAASKHGITGWSNSIQQELVGKVRVISILPAKTNSSMSAGRGPPEEMIQPQDVAEAALLPFRMTSKACPSEIVIRNAVDAGGT